MLNFRRLAIKFIDERIEVTVHFLHRDYVVVVYRFRSKDGDEVIVLKTKTFADFALFKVAALGDF